jgi:UDP-glucose 4-epimerase
MIMFSSMAVYGKQVPPFDEVYPRCPVDIYGQNKRSMEEATEVLSDLHGFKYTIIRPHNVTGCRQAISDSKRNVAGIFMNRIMRGEPLVIYGDGSQCRSFSGIEYSLPCYVKCLELNTNEIVNIGGTQEITILDMAQEVIEAMGEKSSYPIKFLPDRPLEVKYAWSTYKKSQDLLGYSEPVDGWKASVWKMAAWAKTLGPQDWMPTRLELINEKTPKSWLPDFDPHKL